MGNLQSFTFFPIKKPSQESHALSSNELQPAFLKYYLEENQQLPPEMQNYTSATDLVIDLAGRNRLAGDEERAIACAKSLSLWIFKSMDDHFSAPEEIFYISKEYYEIFATLLQKNHCIFPNFFLSEAKSELAIAELCAILLKEGKLSYSSMLYPPLDHAFKI
jgi:hypothetical protein